MDDIYGPHSLYNRPYGSPQELVDTYVASAPSGYTEPPENLSRTEHEKRIRMGERGKPRGCRRTCGVDQLSEDIITEALRAGRGCWREVAYELVPDLPQAALWADVPCNIRGHRPKVSLEFSPNVVHVRIDGVWFDLDGLEAVCLLDGYSPLLGAEMIIECVERGMAFGRNR